MLKQIAVISILIVQLGLLFNKSFTVLHFFLHRAEIMEHFCHHATHEEEENCQGICYLKAEMSKEDNSPVKNFPLHSLLQDDVVYYEMPFVFSLKTPVLKDENTPDFIVKTPVLYDNFLSIWRPPAIA